MIPETNSRREWEQSEEWRQQKAEGERRKWEWEGLQQTGRSVTHDGKTMTSAIGTRTQPPVEEAEKSWQTDRTNLASFQLYPLDQEGLERELRDLDRDAELMLKHEQVNYEDILDPVKNCCKCGSSVRILEGRFAENPLCKLCLDKYPIWKGWSAKK